jgi:uncharacterized protein (TIGR02147 family)
MAYVMDILGQTEYRGVIRAMLDEHRSERGYQKRLAAAAGCHTSFLSQVLNSHIQLTPDHAAGLARHWGLTDGETDYFLTLVNRERSSSPALQSFLEARLTQLREQHSLLARRLKADHQISDENKARYYSSWHYSAVHVLLTIPSFRTPEAVARKLRIDVSRARRCLDDLVAMGLAERSDLGEWTPLSADVHISADSPLSVNNHCNWRGMAMQALQEGGSGGLHYTSVHSLSRADLATLKAMVLELIKKSRALVTPSPEEELISVQIDLFPVGAEAR